MEPVDRQLLKEAFSKRVRRVPSIPDPSGTNWEDIDFYSWFHFSGHEAYLAFWQDGELVGRVLHVTRQTSIRATICSVCLTAHPPAGARYFTTTTTRDGRRVALGHIMCSDLKCSLYVRRIISAGAAQMTEHLSIPQRVARLRHNLEQLWGRSVETAR